MILFDSNVLIHAMGTEHPNNSLALSFLNRERKASFWPPLMPKSSKR
jgi:hypothetical protein